MILLSFLFGKYIGNLLIDSPKYLNWLCMKLFSKQLITPMSQYKYQKNKNLPTWKLKIHTFFTTKKCQVAQFEVIIYIYWLWRKNWEVGGWSGVGFNTVYKEESYNFSILTAAFTTWKWNNLYQIILGVKNQCDKMHRGRQLKKYIPKLFKKIPNVYCRSELDNIFRGKMSLEWVDLV